MNSRCAVSRICCLVRLACTARVDVPLTGVAMDNSFVGIALQSTSRRLVIHWLIGKRFTRRTASDSLDVWLVNALASESRPASRAVPRTPSELWRSHHVDVSVPTRPLRVPAAAACPSDMAACCHRRYFCGPAQRWEDQRHLHHPGTEAQNAASVLTTKLPAFSGGQSTIVFATAGSTKVTDPAARPRSSRPWASSDRAAVVSVASPFSTGWCRQPARSRSARCSGRPRRPGKGREPARRHGRHEAAGRDGVEVQYNGSVYPGWRTAISEVPELIGLIVAFGILMITFGAFAAAACRFSARSSA